MTNEKCSDKKYILGIDIGNSTTEAAMAEIGSGGSLDGYASGLHPTTGLKGTEENIKGIEAVVSGLLESQNIDRSQVVKIRINEAAPVIGDFAMETITKTVVTESTMIGHNPDTPGGEGVATGATAMMGDTLEKGKEYVLIVPGEMRFNKTAQYINECTDQGINITGAILQNDDGVLVNNRLNRPIPIVDEVKHIERIPVGMFCAVEVVRPGNGIQMLSNPYGIATLMNLSSEETRAITPVAKALAGLRSAVVIRTPQIEVSEKTIPLGMLIVKGESGTRSVDVGSGAAEIMECVGTAGSEISIEGEKGTVIGGVVAQIKDRIAKVINQQSADITIRDVLAIDTVVPQRIAGGFEGEYANENAVAVAAMVKTESSHMKQLADYFAESLQIPVEVVGIEVNMAALGTLTTPGSASPLAVVDIGAGSTDACYYGSNGKSRYVHLAGAGNMVTMVIDSEMNLHDPAMAEKIKRYPLAKAESFYSIRHEDGTVVFLEKPLGKELYGKTVIITEDEMIPIDTKLPMERIRTIRRGAKESILVQNIIRGLKKISPTGSLTAYDHVLMVGGSALDFELGSMVTEKLERYGVAAGRANIMGTEGPRGAVATGLLISADR